MKTRFSAGLGITRSLQPIGGVQCFLWCYYARRFHQKTLPIFLHEIELGKWQCCRNIYDIDKQLVVYEMNIPKIGEKSDMARS